MDIIVDAIFCVVVAVEELIEVDKLSVLETVEGNVDDTDVSAVAAALPMIS